MVTEDMLQDITINNVLVDDLYNDLGFSIGDKLIVLVEAQSTFSYNIVIRALMYLVQTYHEYFARTDQDLYGTRKATMPKPELYVIYTGERQSKPEDISLSKDFFAQENPAIDARVKVIYDGMEGDIIYQYIMFAKTYDGQRKKYGRTEKAIRETIRICKDRNLLKEYLESREKEVVTMMMTLYDEEQIMKAYTKRVQEEAELQGIIEACHDFGMAFKDTVKKIASKFHITEEETESESILEICQLKSDIVIRAYRKPKAGCLYALFFVV